MRVDGHTVIAPDYVRQCVRALRRTDADNVGGRMDAVGVTRFGEAVALATSSPFGVGGGRFHYSQKEEWTDTTYMGVWHRGAVAPDGEDCACGRQLPVLLRLDGRQDDLVLTRDGRRIGRLDPVFKADLPIREAQIIQESLDHIRVRYIPAPGCSKTGLDSLVKRLKDRVGDMEIELEAAEQIPRTKAGKFQAIISRLKENA